ncbi:hypothetical protein Mp_8g15040 [Marchantia polymorpha subsp. ruderalis]|uniref:Uncharacterized protein n=1 Tax=Marchantia polymorpha TaxID=3197 RepID=A0A2R6W500_MARPO|nr:hypothetical protein MARPO_0151s0002 [Marchantia polymorpha]BBN19940.1 hypothetical protein Mp_8g15040 [Marchantia polymorpha subsp. ruderalis]|eukprot:PTQ28924.1 hypothetical protein MARPO_0151s0002 [Marchantia polymorpha]
MGREHEERRPRSSFSLQLLRPIFARKQEGAPKARSSWRERAWWWGCACDPPRGEGPRRSGREAEVRPPRRIRSLARV